MGWVKRQLRLVGLGLGLGLGSGGAGERQLRLRGMDRALLLVSYLRCQHAPQQLPDDG